MQSGLPLYLKLSPIYNKIMQLAIAIMLLVVVLNLLITASEYNKELITKHFTTLGEQLGVQTSVAFKLLLAEEKTEAIQEYIDKVAATKPVHSLYFYQPTGRLLFSSKQASSINQLYGLEKDHVNLSEQFVPFVQEIRENDKLMGYLRVNLDKKVIVQPLLEAEIKTNETYRIVLVLAGLIGFLLTRGLNRFSRQGFRLAESLKAQHK